jgi:glycine cleavage system H protein
VYPDDLKYTAEHEWARVREDGADTVLRIGITDFAQEALGDIVFVSLPALGADLSAGQALGEVESTKSVSDIYAPVAGTVSAVNERLTSAPETVNSDPYGEGWLVELTVTGDAQTVVGGAALLDASAYTALLP